MTDRPISRALISVSDKNGLDELAKALQSHGVEILSTGGTARFLKEQGLDVTDVSDHTGFPEMMDGRVKTLHPKIHGGLLALRENDEHRAAMETHKIAPIDLVVVNLYPFEETVAKGADFDETIENIDIGGPSMVRSAAKNHAYVTIATSPNDYPELIEALQANQGATTAQLRRELAARAFARTASYDAAISQWFTTQVHTPLPERFTLAGEKKQALRYGENPHQKAAFYVTDQQAPGVANATQLQGKELSFNNIHDTEAAFELVRELEGPAISIIKHANPCGAAIGSDLHDAYQKALASDPVSAFGGIIAANQEVDGKTAEAMKSLFAEVIIAPAFSREARELLSSKKNLRLLETGPLETKTSRPPFMIKTVAGGFLVQESDHQVVKSSGLKCVTQKQPTEQELHELLFAFTVCKHVKSNAIVLAQGGATIGIGGGQTSRVDAVRNAIWQANQLIEDSKGVAVGDPSSGKHFAKRSLGALLASDAFFPFADNIELAAEAGIKAIIQPGGSVRDEEVIAAADRYEMAMVFTGQRHFKH